MKDFVELILSYPLWVRVAILVLQGLVFALLVFCRSTPRPAPHENGRNAEPTVSTTSIVKADSSAGSSEPTSYPALLATFANMTRGSVELNVQIQVIPNKAPQLVANFGNPEAAIAAARAYIEGRVRDEMIQLTIAEARHQRALVGERVMASAKHELEDQYCLTIHQLIIGEIWATNGAAQPADAADGPSDHR